jgi:WD40 repeat protein
LFFLFYQPAYPSFFEMTSYELHTILQGASDSVQSLAFSVHGKFLAAIGKYLSSLVMLQLLKLVCLGRGGVSVWSLDNFQAIAFSSKTPMHRVYSSMAWLYFEQTSQHVLILGTIDGEMELWNLSNRKLVCIE